VNLFGYFFVHGDEETTKCEKLLGKIVEVIFLPSYSKTYDAEEIFGIAQMFASHQSK
jgi:hypothetical protein